MRSRTRSAALKNIVHAFEYNWTGFRLFPADVVGLRRIAARYLLRAAREQSHWRGLPEERNRPDFPDNLRTPSSQGQLHLWMAPELSAAAVIR